jgi:hypothetical protein
VMGSATNQRCHRWLYHDALQCAPYDPHRQDAD